MTFDESQGFITNELHGKIVDYVYYDGLDLVIVTECGHEIHLASTVDHVITFKKTSVKIQLPRIQISSNVGQL